VGYRVRKKKAMKECQRISADGKPVISSSNWRESHLKDQDLLLTLVVRSSNIETFYPGSQDGDDSDDLRQRQDNRRRGRHIGRQWSQGSHHGYVHREISPGWMAFLITSPAPHPTPPHLSLFHNWGGRQDPPPKQFEK
jgi:hypothetical protein